MRKKATLELWKELFEKAKEIEELKPWNYFSEANLVAIILEDKEEPMFVSISGTDGGFRSISVYQGIDGYGDFDMASTVGQSYLSEEYVLFEQKVLALHWENMMKVAPEQREIIDQIDVKFQNLDSWMEFISYEKRFWPHLPDQEEVKLLIEIYKNLIMVIRAVRDGKLEIHAERGDFVYRRYDKETKKWEMFLEAAPDIEKQFPAVELNDEELKKELQEKPQNNAEIILDFCYAGFPVKDEVSDLLIHPLLFLAMDESSSQILDAYFLSPNDHEIDAALNFFIAYIERHGRMKKIKARNPWIFGALTNICSLCQVELVHDPLEQAEAIEQQIKKQAEEAL